MADLLIKDTFFPLRCEDCNFCEDIGGFGCSVNHLVIIRRHGQDKPSWCPLVEVPTHGRLVDWDEVEKCVEETADCEIKQYALFLISWAAEKRVVIEASDGGEQDG